MYKGVKVEDTDVQRKRRWEKNYFFWRVMCVQKQMSEMICSEIYPKKISCL